MPALQAYPQVDNGPVVALVILAAGRRADVAPRGGQQVLALIGRPWWLGSAQSLPVHPQRPVSAFVVPPAVGSAASYHVIASLIFEDPGPIHHAAPLGVRAVATWRMAARVAG
jgi:hypothetical protein